MPLTLGDKLGPYEILGPLGAGGMGEVYRARDAKLNREVAIKVLPAALANDADYLARFQREAQALAALHHPNIATIFGLEQNAIVMELVEGKTLAGPLPLAEALPLARQIAEALEAAHDKGIIHRDLKPGNIKVTPEGVVKVLDFGLATTAAAASPATTADSPTLTMRATQAGMILGTAGYMSPEQAVGKPVDRRADIWSFGVVLVEMLSGKRLFDGETVSHTLADVIKGDIDLTAVPEGPVRDLARRCLDRNLKTRLRDIGEARIAIDNYLANPAAPPLASPVNTQKPGGWVAAALCAIIAAGASWMAWRTPPPVAQPLVRFNLDLGPDALLETNFARFWPFALSQDGRRIAYPVKSAGGVPMLATRLLNQEQVLVLPGTENAQNAFISWDGQWIAFHADSKLKKVAVTGGSPIVLCDAPNLRGGSWAEDGSIVAALDIRAGISRIPGSGGTPQPVTTLAGDDKTHRWPQALPGDAGVLFISSPTPGNYESANIEVQSRTGKRKVLHRGGYAPHYLASGHLIFMSQGVLFAAPFNLDRLELTAPPVPVLYNVEGFPGGGAMPLAASDSGTLIYRTGIAIRSTVLAWTDLTGKVERIPMKAAAFSSLSLAPDGKRVALWEASTAAFHLYDFERSALSRLLVTGRPNPAWTPNGRHLIFQKSSGLFALRSDGAGTPQQLTGNAADVPGAWLPDGSVMYFERNTQLWRLPVDWSDENRPKPGKLEQLTAGGTMHPLRISPDGRWLASTSPSSGSFEVYVTSLIQGGGRWQISSDGGDNPVWSPRGELLYRRLAGGIMAVPYTVRGDTFVPDKARVFAEAANLVPGQISFELSADGKRYLSLVDPDGARAESAQTVLLLNFFDELKRLRPATK